MWRLPVWACGWRRYQYPHTTPSPAEYDPKKPVKVTGIVEKVEWTNPHSRMYLDVKDANGTVTVWNFEFGSPNHLFRAGWTRNTVKEGDQITGRGLGSQRRVPTWPKCSGQVILADGKKVPGFCERVRKRRRAETVTTSRMRPESTSAQHSVSRE